MPLIKVYKQVRERWNLTKGLCFSVESRYRFDMDEYSYLERRPECVVHHLGRCSTLTVKVPPDAVFEPLNPPATGWLRWERSPIFRFGGATRDVHLTADQVVAIAERGLRADNGDTFRLVDKTTEANHAAMARAGEAGPLLHDADRRGDPSRRGDRDGDGGPGDGQGGHPGASASGRGGEGGSGRGGPVELLSPDGTLRLVLPPGYRAESSGPAKLVIVGGDKHHTTNWALLASLIEQEHPDWRLVPAAAPEPASTHINPYRGERIPARRTKTPVAATGQGSLF